MARTRVNARKVTGGKPPGQQLRDKLARSAAASGGAEEAAAAAVKVKRKNYVRKTTGEPCTRKRLASPSLIDVDDQGNEDPQAVVQSMVGKELDGTGLEGTASEADVHDLVRSLTRSDIPP